MLLFPIESIWIDYDSKWIYENNYNFIVYLNIQEFINVIGNSWRRMKAEKNLIGNENIWHISIASDILKMSNNKRQIEAMFDICQSLIWWS